MSRNRRHARRRELHRRGHLRHERLFRRPVTDEPPERREDADKPAPDADRNPDPFYPRGLDW